MFVQKYDKFITKSKFQKASIFRMNDSEVAITISTEVQTCQHEDEDEILYLHQTYVSSEKEELVRFNRRIFDIKQDSNEQGMIIFQEDNYFGYDIYRKRLNMSNRGRQIPFYFESAKIVNQDQLITLNCLKNKLALSYFSKKEDKSVLYDHDSINKHETINNLHVLSDQRLLFHIGQGTQDHFKNYQLKCFDIESQQVQWKESFKTYTFMMDAIISLASNSFLNACYDREEKMSLRLYDRRVNGTVSNMLNSDDLVWEQLDESWTGRGRIRVDFNNICKDVNQLQIVGMFSFLAGTYNYPYLLDLRRPNTVLPMNYPHGKFMSHLKRFDIVGDRCIAVERDFARYQFKQARLCEYQIVR